MLFIIEKENYFQPDESGLLALHSAMAPLPHQWSASAQFPAEKMQKKFAEMQFEQQIIDDNGIMYWIFFIWKFLLCRNKQFASFINLN